jgi:hypothetical protein
LFFLRGRFRFLKLLVGVLEAKTRRQLTRLTLSRPVRRPRFIFRSARGLFGLWFRRHCVRFTARGVCCGGMRTLARGHCACGVRTSGSHPRVATRPAWPAHSPASPRSALDAQFSGERIHPPEYPHTHSLNTRSRHVLPTRQEWIMRQRMHSFRTKPAK